MYKNWNFDKWDFKMYWTLIKVEDFIWERVSFIYKLLERKILTRFKVKFIFKYFLFYYCSNYINYKSNILKF